MIESEIRPEAQRLDLGVVVAPGLAEDVTGKVIGDLVEDLGRRYDSVDWQAELLVDRLVSPPAPTTEVVDAARRKLLEGDWDLAIVVTDLPLRIGRRHVARHVSPTHGVALVSLPALGPVHLRPRLHRTLLELVSELIGKGDQHRDRMMLQEIAAEAPPRPGSSDLLFVPLVLLGRLRLLLGMVRANRPWRLAMRLYGALVAALAAAAYGIVTGDIWQISDAMSWWRLGAVSGLSISVTVVAIIAAHGLWEPVPDPRVRDQVALFNIATGATVALGILTLYLALFVLVLAGAELVITEGLLSRRLGHAVGQPDYLALAWFVASLATVGGALGAALDSDDAAREAAYASTPSESPKVAARNVHGL